MSFIKVWKQGKNNWSNKGIFQSVTYVGEAPFLPCTQVTRPYPCTYCAYCVCSQVTSAPAVSHRGWIPVDFAEAGQSRRHRLCESEVASWFSNQLQNGSFARNHWPTKYWWLWHHHHDHWIESNNEAISDCQWNQNGWPWQLRWRNVDHRSTSSAWFSMILIYLTF